MLTFMSTISFSQSRNVTGKVTDSFGSPASGVSVIVKGTDRGTVTDSEGEYSLKVKTGDTLTFFSIGYSSKEIGIGPGQNEIDVVIDLSDHSLHGWCCTDHPSPEGPHCGKSRDELKKEFKCTMFVADN